MIELTYSELDRAVGRILGLCPQELEVNALRVRLREKRESEALVPSKLSAVE